MDNEKTIIKQFSKILLADDEIDLANMAIDNLSAEGFRVIYAKDGVEAMELVYKEMPDLILLDIKMPKKDGYTVFKELKADMLIANIPVIMLTSKSKIQDQIFGLDLGVDDYITKPYDIEELISRVKKVLSKKTAGVDINSITRLPGRRSVDHWITDAINKRKPFAAIYICINNFKPFNDYYGINRGDEVIRVLGRILIESLSELGYRNIFIGHIGRDDFVIVTIPERVVPLCKKILAKFDALVSSFYDPKDREKNYITVDMGKGNLVKFNFISLAIGVTTSEYKKFTSSIEVSKIGNEMKDAAKEFKDIGTVYIVDKHKMQ